MKTRSNSQFFIFYLFIIVLLLAYAVNNMSYAATSTISMSQTYCQELSGGVICNTYTTNDDGSSSSSIDYINNNTNN